MHTWADKTDEAWKSQNVMNRAFEPPMTHAAAIEWANAAILELDNHPSRPGCLFRDISDFVLPEFRTMTGQELMKL